MSRGSYGSRCPRRSICISTSRHGDVTPNPINNLALVGNTYIDAATISKVYGGQGGSFYITGGNFYAKVTYGQQGSEQERAEKLSGPGPGTIDRGAIGIAFRNADPANPATIVSAEIIPPGQAGFSINAPSNVASSAKSSVITGIIPAAGTTPTAGTGFTYTHTNGTGIYVVSFTTPFAATPIILADQQPSTGADQVAKVTAVGANGFTVQTGNTAGALADRAWSFVAQPVA